MDILTMYLLYKLHLLVRYVFKLGQGLVWRINGTASTLQEIWNGDLYERSAQVLDIVWRFKPVPLSTNCPENFVTTHKNFAHPDIIRSDEVSLICVAENEAIFAEVPPDVDLYSCAKCPLVFMHQYDAAIRLIRMPISSFHRIAREIGDPDDKEVIIVHFTGRCGSTLMVQLLERLRLSSTGRPTFSLAECTSFEPVFSNRRNYDEREFLEILRSSFRVLCKYETALVVIKVFLETWIRLAPEFSSLFPRFHQLFTDRASLPQMKSRLRVNENAMDFRIMYFAQSHPFAARWLHLPRGKLLRHYYGDELYEQLKQGNTLMHLTRFESLSLYTLALKKTYIDCYNSGTSIAAVRLEDINLRGHATLRQVLTHCKLEAYRDQIPEVLKAMENDSHGNNPEKRCRMNRGEIPEIVSAADIISCDALCDRFGLPRLSDTAFLPGTISPVQSVSTNNSI